MKIIMLGAPGAGKGTQAKMIAEKYAIPHVSTGDIFRANIKNGTELGMEAKKYMDQGQLVPNELTVKILLDRVAQDDCQNGYVLDGFPRTIPQAKALDEMGVKVDLALSIEVKDDVIVERMSGRRVCDKCGASYHTKYNPSKDGVTCDKDGNALTLRKDDAPEVVKSRLETYHTQTEPIKEYYAGCDKLKTVDGEQDVAEITTAIIEILNKIGR